MHVKEHVWRLYVVCGTEEKLKLQSGPVTNNGFAGAKCSCMILQATNPGSVQYWLDLKRAIFINLLRSKVMV